MNQIQLDDVTVRVNKKIIVTKLSLKIEKGKCVALLGPSGAGKTTLLRVIAGFVIPYSGQVNLAGLDVTRELPERRNVTMLFQDPVLFPDLTVHRNATVGLSKERGSSEQDYIIKRLSKIVDVEELLSRTISDGLSGGQRQRAALLRTFANAKETLLLDEPLKSAFNVELRWKLMRGIKMLAREDEKTTLIVTHDFEEAAYLADEIAVISENGTGLWKGPAWEMYYDPPNLQVARVLGNGIEIDAALIFNREKRESTYPFIFENGEPKPIPRAHIVFIRPNKISIEPEGYGFKIKDISFLGDYSLIEIISKNEERLNGNKLFASSSPYIFSKKDLNKDVGIKLSNDSLIVFNQEGERIYGD